MIQLPELNAADRRFDFRHPIIEADHVHEGSSSLSFDNGLGVIANQLQTLAKDWIVGDCNSAFASVDCLVIVEAEHADVSERSRKSAVISSSWRLSGIFDYDETVLLRERHDLVHLRR